MARSRTTYLVTGCLIIIVVALGLIYTMRSKEEIHDFTGLQNVHGRRADANLKDVCYTEVRNGFKEWVLNADSASYFEHTGNLLLNRIHMVFYGKNGKRISLTGEKGKLNTTTKDIEVHGNIVVISEDGYQLKTDSLNYFSSKRYMFTKDRVWIEGKDVMTEGKGLEFDVDTKRVIILRDAKTTLRRSKTPFGGWGSNLKLKF